MVREGLVATISDQPDRGAVFWFFSTGFALALIMPASGFWLLILPIVGAIVRNRRLSTAAAPLPQRR